jgi:hypothetical protein
MRGAPLPRAGQHSNKQAIIPDSDRLQRKVWFQDTLRNQERAITVYGIPTLVLEFSLPKT